MTILIRKAKPGDEIGIAKMKKEGFKRKNWNYTGSNDLPDKKKLEKMRKSFSDKKAESFSFVAIDTKQHKIIGSISSSFRKKGRLRHRIDMGWGVHPDYQGKGIGTKLLRESLKFAKQKGFKRAEAEAATENIASVKIAKKCGFKIDGKREKGLLLDNGKYVDTYIFGKILR
jgi:RimJ/RimL family protein N-acetyltransferase